MHHATQALEQYLEERHEEVTVYAYTSFTFLRQTKQLELVASTGDSIQLEAASREVCQFAKFMA